TCVCSCRTRATGASHGSTAWALQCRTKQASLRSCATGCSCRCSRTHGGASNASGSKNSIATDHAARRGAHRYAGARPLFRDHLMLITTISPVDGRVYAQRPAATAAEIEATLARAHASQPAWRAVPVAARTAIMERFCRECERRGPEIATQLSWQMGRPIRFAPSEVRGTLERARYMSDIASTALADLDAGPKPGFRRFIRREPLGVVFSVAAWNYPYLIAVNSVVPALMAGKALVLTDLSKTPSLAEELVPGLPPIGLTHRHF